MFSPALRPRRSTRNRAAKLTSGAPTFAVLVALTVLVGCSDDPGGDASPTTGTVTDPCSLLTVEQIEAATGWDVPAGERPGAAPESDPAICNWQDVSAGGAVQVRLVADGGERGFERDRAAAVAEGAAGTDGAGVPDDLVIDSATAAFEMADLGQLTMLVGDDVVQLTVVGADLDGDERRQLATDVAVALP